MEIIPITLNISLLEIALPISLLLLAFLLKLFIDRTATLPFFIEAVLELPVDIAFLSTAFVVAFTISFPSKVKEGLFSFTFYIIGSIIVVFFWRRSRMFFEREKFFKSGLLAIINYILCLMALLIAVFLLSGKYKWK